MIHPLSLPRVFPVLLAVLLPVLLPAQTTAPSVKQLKSWVAARQQTVDLLREEIKQTDARIESRLDALVEALTAITDSKESRTKVARMKEATGKRLLKAIDYYQQKRTSLRQDLLNPAAVVQRREREQLIALFDSRIEKRTRQILALHKSMPSHQDYERYEATGSSWQGTQYKLSEDYAQNRRMTSHLDLQRKSLVRQLDGSIARLDRFGRELRSQLSATSDPAQQKERAAEIAKNDALIAERRKQRLEVLRSPGEAGRSVGSKEAADLDQALQKATDELRRDFDILFSRYNTYMAELTKLRATEATLASAAGG